MPNDIIKMCSNCYFHSELNADDVFCYFDRDRPVVKNKNDVCVSWSKSEDNMLGEER